MESSTIGGIDVIKLTFKLYYGISSAGSYLHEGSIRHLHAVCPNPWATVNGFQPQALMAFESQKEGGVENIRSRILAFKLIIRIIVWDTALSVATALWDRER